MPDLSAADHTAQETSHLCVTNGPECDTSIQIPTPTVPLLPDWLLDPLQASDIPSVVLSGAGEPFCNAAEDAATWSSSLRSNLVDLNPITPSGSQSRLPASRPPDYAFQPSDSSSPQHASSSTAVQVTGALLLPQHSPLLRRRPSEPAALNPASPFPLTKHQTTNQISPLVKGQKRIRPSSGMISPGSCAFAIPKQASQKQ